LECCQKACAFEDEPAGGRVVFALKLFLCDFASPATALAHLAAYRRFLERRLESYERLEARAASSRRYPEHLLRHGLARVRATLAWIDNTTAAIESDTVVGRVTRSAGQRYP
jgi:hypothetical protein